MRYFTWWGTNCKLLPDDGDSDGCGAGQVSEEAPRCTEEGQVCGSEAQGGVCRESMASWWSNVNSQSKFAWRLIIRGRDTRRLRWTIDAGLELTAGKQGETVIQKYYSHFISSLDFFRNKNNKKYLEKVQTHISALQTEGRRIGKVASQAVARLTSAALGLRLSLPASQLEHVCVLPQILTLLTPSRLPGARLPRIQAAG